MKVDETIESVGRVWQQITILIVLHLVFLAWAILAGVVPVLTPRGAIEGVESKGVLAHLVSMHKSFGEVGLELPLVAGILFVVYLISFQRLSALLAQIPPFKLVYSQPHLWRSSKRFDELRKLTHVTGRHWVSPTLENLEVALGLAIAQFSEQFEDTIAIWWDPALQMLRFGLSTIPG